MQRPVIAEPWVERVFDFSTQWEIKPDKNIFFVGATAIENNLLGSYQSTLVGDEKEVFKNYIHFLEMHKESALMILKKISEEGYFGPVGIDAMIYKESEYDHRLILHPIVEINARQTMSLAALRFQRKWFPKKIITWSYTNVETQASPLLPLRLAKASGKVVDFSRNLYFSITV